MAGAGESALVYLSEASFGSQRHSLQQLTLRSVSQNMRLRHLCWCLIRLPALRRLAIQNLGVTNLRWLQPSWNSVPASPLHDLDLDDNAALQLDGEAAAALLNITSLQKVSMRKGVAQDAASTATRVPGPADTVARGTVWSAESVRCIARVVAARPALQFCF